MGEEKVDARQWRNEERGEMLETNKENKSRNRGRKRKREGTERKGKKPKSRTSGPSREGKLKKRTVNLTIAERLEDTDKYTRSTDGGRRRGETREDRGKASGKKTEIRGGIKESTRKRGGGGRAREEKRRQGNRTERVGDEETGARARLDSYNNNI